MRFNGSRRHIYWAASFLQMKRVMKSLLNFYAKRDRAVWRVDCA